MRRGKDEAWLKKIRTMPCLICEGWSQAHHLMHAEPSAMGRRSGDNWAVPLCAAHHRDLHLTGDEQVWWATHGIDPIEWARTNYGPRERED